MSRIKALAPKASGVLVAIGIGISSLVVGSATASADINLDGSVWGPNGGAQSSISITDGRGSSWNPQSNWGNGSDWNSNPNWDNRCNDGCGSARFEAAWDWNYRGGDAFCWDTHSRFGTIWVENINRPGFHLELVDDGGQYPRVYWVR